MPRVPGGVHCSRCDRDVLDLRRAPRKRALAVLAEARASDPEGRVCAWVRATEDGTPVFTPDPSRWVRLAAPAVLATALGACTTAEQAHAAPTVPVAMTSPVTSGGTSEGNTNATPGVVTVTIAATTPPVQAQPQPATNLQPVEIEMAGDMAF